MSADRSLRFGCFSCVRRNFFLFSFFFGSNRRSTRSDFAEMLAQLEICLDFKLSHVVLASLFFKLHRLFIILHCFCYRFDDSAHTLTEASEAVHLLRGVVSDVKFFISGPRLFDVPSAILFFFFVVNANFL